MPANLEVFWGTDAAPIEAIGEAYAAHLQDAKARRTCGTGLWLVPTFRVQREVLQRLSQQTAGCFQPNVFTFAAFAEQLLTTLGEPVQRLSQLGQRRLLRSIVNDFAARKALVHFRGISETSGFIDLLLTFIADLKQDENWPEHFDEALRNRGRVTDRDRELAALYHAYQAALKDHGWYDDEGRFWLARDVISKGQRGRFANLELIAVTGFADFTRTQLEMLGFLAESVPRFLLHLPAEFPTSRNELFAKPLGTLRKLKLQLEEDAVVTFRSGKNRENNGAVPVVEKPAELRQIEHHLFSNLRELPRILAGREIEFLSAIGQHSEWDAVAVRVKRLLQSGVPATEIILAVRQAENELQVLVRHLQRAGLPVHADLAPRLAERPVVQGLLQILRLEQRNWEFDALAQVLHSTLLRPDWWQRDAARALLKRMRRRKLTGDRAAILHVLRGDLQRMEADTQRNLPDDVDHPQALQELQLALQYAEKISRALEPLRQNHSLAEWINRLTSLAKEMGCIPFSAEAHTQSALQHKEIREQDQRDWDFLQRVLRTAAEIDANLHSQPTLFSLDEFLAEFIDLVSSEALPAAAEPSGCVRLLAFTQARHLEVDHLFVMGLTEGSFPQSSAEDCFYSDFERRQLNEHGLNLRHHGDFQQEEQFLFYHGLTKARKFLCLSHAAVDHHGEPRFSSPYLVSVRELFANAIERTTHEGNLDPVPAADRIVSAADFRLAAVAATETGHLGWLTTLCREPRTAEVGRNLLATFRMAEERFHSPGFGPYEGRITNPRGLAELQLRFGLNHTFSATQLEEYATCPFRYWMSHVLDLEPLESPMLGTDTQRRGVIVHRIAAELLGNQQPTAIDLDDLNRKFREQIHRELRATIPETELVAAFNRIELQLLAEWGTQFVEQHAAYAQRVEKEWSSAVRTASPEIPFGKVPEEELAQVESGQHFRPLKFGQGAQAVTVAGKIDRVDFVQNAAGTQYTVIDYKTGSPPKFTEADVRSGRALQLVLYTLAVKRLGIVGEDAWPFQLGYWSIRSDGFESRLAGRKRKWEALDRSIYAELERIVDDLVPKLVSGIRGGEFFVDSLDPDCTGRCPYRTVCRVNQVRPLADSLHKRRSSSAVEANSSPASEGESAS